MKVAEAFNCVGMRCSRPEDIQATIDAAWEVTDKPVVMEFVVIMEEKVFPMVPSGATTDEMITASPEDID